MSDDYKTNEEYYAEVVKEDIERLTEAIETILGGVNLHIALTVLINLLYKGLKVADGKWEYYVIKFGWNDNF